MQWFLPTFYGDIQVERLDNTRCRVVVSQTSLREKEALRDLEVYAGKKAWLSPNTPMPIDAGTVELRAPVDKVSRYLARALKPGRQQVSVVRFKDGAIEEISESQPLTLAVAQNGELTIVDDKPAAPAPEVPKPKPKPVETATTIAKPVQGCPPPDFNPARLRARRVLMAFLDAEQKDDFQRTNRFVSTGGATGERYMITSRHARDALRDYHRTLFNLDQRLPLCVHDWDVPAEEEMLALHLLVRLPQYERDLWHVEG